MSFRARAGPGGSCGCPSMRDFADLFEVKFAVRDRSAGITRSHHAATERCLRLRRRRVRRLRPVSRCRPAGHPRRGRRPGLGRRAGRHREEWHVDLHVPLPPGPGVVEAVRGTSPRSSTGVPTTRCAAGWRSEPSCTATIAVLERATQTAPATTWPRSGSTWRSDGQRVMLPGAGLPWFLTVFGRDTLITAYQTLVAGPTAGAGGAAGAGAAPGTRAATTSPTRSPGKILHEFRSGELTRTGVEAVQPVLRHRRRHPALADPAVRVLAVDRRRRASSGRCATTRYAALRWIDEYGDRDGDGYVEYAHPLTARGSATSAGGTPRTGCASPTGGSRCCRSPPASSRATRTTRSCASPSWPTARWPIRRWRGGCAPRPAQLRERFNRDFWIDERGGYYAIGLDGDKNRIDSMTSNMGHLLWSGIVPPERAEHGGPPADVRRHVLRLGHPHPVHGRTGGYNPHRLPPRHRLAARQLPRGAGAGPVRLPRRGRTGSAWPCCEAADAVRQPAAGGVLRVRPRSVRCSPCRTRPRAARRRGRRGAPLALVRAMLGLNPVDGRADASTQTYPPEVGRITAERVRAFGHSGRWRRWAHRAPPAPAEG